MTRLRCLLAVGLLCILGACAPAANQQATPDTAGTTAPAPAPTAAPAPAPASAPVDSPATAAPVVAAEPAPPRSIAVGEPNPSAPGVVDASCRTDADCAIKDVGSCCGYHPACVNAASPTFPERVKAQCASSGRVSTCGFPAISGCTCHAGQCEGTGADAGAKVQ